MKYSRVQYGMLGLLLVLCLRTDLAYGITVQFYSKATVNTEFIQLGDIAKISEGTPEEIQTYQHVRLAPSPPSGAKTYLDFEQIRTRLQALGHATGTIEFLGRTRILIESNQTYQPIQGNRSSRNSNSRVGGNSQESQLDYTLAERIVKESVRFALQSSLTPSELAELEITVRFNSTDSAMFKGSNPRDWRIAGWSATFEQQHLLVFTRSNELVAQRPILVQCQLTLPPKVVSVRQTVVKGQEILASDLEWMHASLPDALTRMEPIVGMKAKHTIQPNRPIRLSDLEKKTYVRPRDIVAVEARYNGIVVKRDMRALGAGGLGDSVLFVTLDGKQKIMARILDYRQAEVDQLAR